MTNSLKLFMNWIIQPEDTMEINTLTFDSTAKRIIKIIINKF